MEYIQAKFSIGDLLSKLLSSITKIPSFMDGFDVTKTDANMNGSAITCSRVLQSQKYGSLTVTVGVDKFTDADVIKDCIATLEKCSKAKSFDLAQSTVNNQSQTDNSSDTSSNDANSDDDYDAADDPMSQDTSTWGSTRIQGRLQKVTASKNNILPGLSDLCGLSYVNNLDDLNSKSATAESLLAPKLTDKTDKINSLWQAVANSLKYNIRCEAQGYTGGSASGKTINQIIPMVSQYLQKCGAVPQSEVAGFNINPVYFVLPLLIAIQDYMAKYLDSVNAIVNDKSIQNQQQQNSQNQQQGQQQNQQNQQQGQTQNTQQNQQTPTAQNQNTSSTQSNAGASKLVDIKLQKITGSTDIDLMAIKANFNPGEALTAVDDVLSSPDFIELITETPQSYEVLVDDAGYDVNPCTDLIVEPNENLTQLFIQAIQFSRNLHMIHWLAIGNDMEKLHIKAEELYIELDEEIDLLAELIVEKTGTVIDINMIETWDTVGTQDRTFQQGIECIKQYAQSFIDYIDITYPNQPSDVQSILDDWLRYWNKQINYFINREQEI